MKLNLSQIFDGTIYKLDLDERLNIHTSGSSLDTERDIKIDKPVHIEGSIYATEDGVYLSSNLTYEYIENCARCLTEFSEEIETVLSAKITENANQQNEEDDDDEVIIDYDGRSEDFKIEEAIDMAILLSLPMKSVCGEECEGLCAQCGQNLNTGSCDCKSEDVDIRLEKLKDLFD